MRRSNVFFKAALGPAAGPAGGCVSTGVIDTPGTASPARVRRHAAFPSICRVTGAVDLRGTIETKPANWLGAILLELRARSDFVSSW